MRGITRTMLRACAGFAVAAGLVAGGAGVASAAPVTPAKPAFGPSCSPWSLQHWNLNGHNQVKATYLGGNYTYNVTFKQAGSCLTGTLTDSLFPTTGAVFGVVNKNHVTFSFRYPNSGTQGTRTFSGTISNRGVVAGTWSETGTEHGHGTWKLASNAKLACPWWFGWNPTTACPVIPHR
jgi:hypothetical protein